MKLRSAFLPAFDRDIKKLKKKHKDTHQLKHCMRLILENTLDAREELIRHHGVHTLSGSWAESRECHVCNAGDWLLVWREVDGVAYFQRTGTHDEIFRSHHL